MTATSSHPATSWQPVPDLSRVVDITTPGLDSLHAHDLRRIAEKEAQLSGVKHDAAKPRWDCVPWAALEQLVAVMTFGAEKYGRYNYRGGMAYSRLFAAALRHLTAWEGGADSDPESGLPHLAHAAACVLMLLDLAQLELPEDDRWTKPPPSSSPGC